MKLLTIIFIMTLLSCAGYKPTPLTNKQIAAIAAFEVVNALDWSQTIYIKNHPKDFHENGLFLGDNPSRGKINLVMGATALLYPVATWLIPDKYRKWWLGGTIATKTGIVIYNSSIGIGFDF